MARLVEVIGPGCRRCSELLEVVRDVAHAERLAVEVRYVTDPAEIVGRGFFMRTPALVIDGTVVSAGRVPERAQVIAWVHPHASAPQPRGAGAPPRATPSRSTNMKVIEVLGPGCPNCQKLEANAREAVAQAGIEAEIVKVTDYADIVSRGVMSTPGLVIDGKVVSTGKIPTSWTIAAWLTE